MTIKTGDFVFLHPLSSFGEKRLRENGQSFKVLLVDDDRTCVQSLQTGWCRNITTNDEHLKIGGLEHA